MEQKKKKLVGKHQECPTFYFFRVGRIRHAFRENYRETKDKKKYKKLYSTAILQINKIMKCLELVVF